MPTQPKAEESTAALVGSPDAPRVSRRHKTPEMFESEVSAVDGTRGAAANGVDERWRLIEVGRHREMEKTASLLPDIGWIGSVQGSIESRVLRLAKTLGLGS